MPKFGLAPLQRVQLVEEAAEKPGPKELERRSGAGKELHGNLSFSGSEDVRRFIVGADLSRPVRGYARVAPRLQGGCNWYESLDAQRRRPRIALVLRVSGAPRCRRSRGVGRPNCLWTVSPCV